MIKFKIKNIFDKKIVVLILFFASLVILNSVKAENDFKIIEVLVDKLDAVGRVTDEYRSFGIQFNQKVDSFSIKIYRSLNNELLLTIPVNGGLSSYYVSPGGWGSVKLEPNLEYKFVIEASSYDTGERLVYEDHFETGDFTSNVLKPNLEINGISEYNGKVRIKYYNKGGVVFSEGIRIEIKDLKGAELDGETDTLSLVLNKNENIENMKLMYANFDVLPGDYEIMVTIDADDNIQESDEDDNTATNNVKIFNPSAEWGWHVVTANYYQDIEQIESGVKQGRRISTCENICADKDMIAYPKCTALNAPSYCDKSEIDNKVLTVATSCVNYNRVKQIGSEYCCCVKDSGFSQEDTNSEVFTDGDKNNDSDESKPDLIIKNIERSNNAWVKVTFLNQGAEFNSSMIKISIRDVEGREIREGKKVAFGYYAVNQIMEKDKLIFANFLIDPGAYMIEATIDGDNVYNESNEDNNSIIKEVIIVSASHDKEKCFDSDGGYDIYKKGDYMGYGRSGDYLTGSDFCSNGVDNSTQSMPPVNVVEFKCNEKSNIIEPFFINRCENGCLDGACLVLPDDESMNMSNSSDKIKVINVENSKMYSNLKGKILLKVEDAGSAYYVNPKSETMHYLGRPDDAFGVMKEQGVGIINIDLYKIPVGVSGVGADSDGDGLPDNLESTLGLDANKSDTDGDGYSDKDELASGYSPWGKGRQNIDNNFSLKHKGKILLQVEKKGEAWYVNPGDGKRYFLGRPADAFNVMRNLGLGISDADFDSM